MSKSILITRPQHDDTVSYLSAWADKIIISFCDERGIKVFDLVKEKANRAQFENTIKINNPRLIALNGHGSEDTVFGQNNEPILDSRNQKIASSKIVHALACDSATVLGEELATKHNSTYIGYDEEFTYLSDDFKSTQPLNDLLLKSFLEPANMVVETILKGNTAEEAYNRSQERYDSWIRYHLTHYTTISPIAISWLLWDKFHQKLKGDKTARF